MELRQVSSASPIPRSQQRFDMALARLERDALVCPENREQIRRFSKNRLASGASSFRVVKCMYCLRFLAAWLKTPFADATKDELIDLVGTLEGKKYSENTKYDFKVVLKLFYKWLKGNDEEFPQEIKWLKPRLRNTAQKLPEELLTEDEVLRIARAANHPRDKAFVLVLYESGCRIGEMLSLKVKNVQFDQYGAILRVTGKTGDRRVRIISSAPALTAWLDLYEYSKEPNAALWPPRSNRVYQSGISAEPASFYAILRGLATKAGVNKRVYPHLFRHSRATFLASKLTEAQMKEHFGWTQSSEMAATYVHLSGRDVDNTLLALYHVTDENGNKLVEKEPEIQAKSCPRCKEKNSPISRFCYKCGNPLDELPALSQSNPAITTN